MKIIFSVLETTKNTIDISDGISSRTYNVSDIKKNDNTVLLDKWCTDLSNIKINNKFSVKYESALQEKVLERPLYVISDTSTENLKKIINDPNIGNSNKCIKVYIKDTSNLGLSSDFLPLPLTSFLSKYRNIAEVEFELGTTIIPTGAFFSNYNMPSTKIPPSVKYIGQGAFYDSSIVSLEIPEGVEGLSGLVFASCIDLALLKLPHSLKTMGENGSLSFRAGQLMEGRYTIIEYNGTMAEWNNLVGPDNLCDINYSDTIVKCNDGSVSDIIEISLSDLLKGEPIDETKYYLIYMDIDPTTVSQEEASKVKFPSEDKILSRIFTEESQIKSLNGDLFRKSPFVKIPSTVETLVDFRENFSIGYIIIPNSVKTLNNCTFEFDNCKKIMFLGTAKEWEMLYNQIEVNPESTNKILVECNDSIKYYNFDCPPK